MEKVILLIDDDENLLRTLKDILDKEGYRTVPLSDPSRAEEFVEKYSPLLLILDIFMPGRSGFNLVEDFKISRICDDIPKIFITCLDDDIERMTARACGVDRYITKPFAPEYVVACVKDMIGEAE
jgi:DNA-binding response OmpR family regulator